MAAEGNIRIANPTTAAQYFHLLRRQALIAKARPLIVFTPKGLLRLARRDVEHRGPDRRRVPFDPRRPERPPTGRETVKRLVLCTGKVYYDMNSHERRETPENVAIARVELLYPFPGDQLSNLIGSYPNLEEVVDPLSAVLTEELRRREADQVLAPRQLLPGRADEQHTEEDGGGEEERPAPTAQPPCSAEAHPGATEKHHHREVLDRARLVGVHAEQAGIVQGEG